jgi:hypothetical protein
MATRKLSQIYSDDTSITSVEDTDLILISRNTEGTYTTKAITGQYIASQAELDEHTTDTDNPHEVTKAQIGLSNVPNLDTTEAISDAHTHPNKALLDTYDQSNSDISDAISLRHSHSNKPILDAVTVTAAELNSTSGINGNIQDQLDTKEDSSNLADVAISGSFDDLTDKPTIPTTIVESIVAGTNVTVDITDPANPIVSASGSGGGSSAWGDITGTLSDQTDLQTALDAKAPSVSPAFTGTPTAPTPSAGDNSTKLATTAYADAAVTAGATPDATTGTKGKVQLAGDLGGTADSPTVPGLVTLASSIALKAPSASPIFTGIPTAPTATAATNSTQIATTAYVYSVIERFGVRITVGSYGYVGPTNYTCSAATGNQTEINQAITDAAASTYGGVVELLGSGFTVSSPIVPLGNVWLRGQGMFVTRITSVSNYTNHLIDNYSAHSPANPWQNAIISDIELDGSNMSSSVASKGLNSTALVNCKFMRIYCHDTTATGLGADDYQSVTVTECIVKNCGYTNKRTVSAISWSSNTLTVTTSAAHGYSVGSVIILTGFVPIPYNGRYVVTTVIDSTHFTIGTSNNSNTNNLTINPGTPTTLGLTSDSLIGHNGIGIASGSLPAEAMIVTNNYCEGNQNNNYLAEADTAGTGANASYIFSNNISVSAGQSGYLSTGTPNVQFNNNYDYGSQFGIQINQVSASRTITAASWLSSVATYTISTAYTYTVGQKVAITGMTQSGYNGYFTITSQPTSTTFTVAMASNPGTATAFGTAQVVTHPTDGCQAIANILINNGLYGIRLPTLSDGVQVESNVIEGCYNYGLQSNSSNTSISRNRIYSCGRDGIYLITGGGDIAPMQHVTMQSNLVYNNGQRISTSPGIEIQSTSNAPLNDIKVSGNLCYDNQDTPTQYYGCIVRSSGTLSNIDISNNDFSGNASGTLLIQYTGNGVLASNNIGANPVGKSELGTVTGTVSLDSKLANFYTMTLGGNISASMPSGLVKGTEMTVVVTQDATGSRTISWSGLALWSNGSAPILSTAAGATDSFKFTWNGTSWVETSRALGHLRSVAEGGTGVTTLTGLVKGNGTSAFTAAVAGTDYLAFSGTSKITVGTSAPTSPSVGDIWIDTN